MLFLPGLSKIFFNHLDEYRASHQDAANDEPETPHDHPLLFAFFTEINQRKTNEDCQYRSEQQHVIAGIVRELLGWDVIRV